jgi:Ni/Co efflux regulator RcnB
MLKLIYSAVIAVSLIAIPMSGKAQESKAKSESSKSAPKAKGTTSQDTTTSKSTTTKKEPTAGQLAARERQKQCGVEWKEAKAAGKTKGTTWPKFWSACNTRLKDKSG